MELRDAQIIAEWAKGKLEPACEQIIIAGSVRRGQPHPKDIELVCVPKRPGRPEFGKPLPNEPLTDTLNALVAAELLIPWGKNGDRYKAYMVRRELGGLAVRLDLFIVRPPATWGVILAIRTGPREYAQWLVTKAQNGGALPNDMRVEKGALWRGEEQIPTPTEEAFFGAIGERWRPPHQRIPRWSRRPPVSVPEVEA